MRTHYKVNKAGRQFIIIFLVLCVIAFATFPLFWALVSSTKSEGDLLRVQVISTRFTFEHYVNLFKLTSFARFFVNSVIVATIVVLLCTTLATFAAYSFTRLSRWNVERLVLILYIIPPVLLVIPNFLIFKMLHLINTYIGLALGHLTYMLPFATLVLVAYFKSIPVELDEAALLDGASRIRVVLSIILPMALPGIVSTAIIMFAFSWDDYLYAYTLISSRNLRTLPLGIAQFSQSQYMEWGMLMAAAVVTTFPMLIFFLLIQRRLLSGLIFAPTIEK